MILGELAGLLVAETVPTQQLALLGDALARIAAAAGAIGCFGAIVDAKDARAEAFYVKYGFAAADTAGKYPRRARP